MPSMLPSCHRIGGKSKSGKGSRNASASKSTKNPKGALEPGSTSTKSVSTKSGRKGDSRALNEPHAEAQVVECADDGESSNQSLFYTSPYPLEVHPHADLLGTSGGGSNTCCGLLLLLHTVIVGTILSHHVQYW